MKEVGVLEAKTQLSALLAELEKTGEPIAITRHGRRVARLTRDDGVAVEPPKKPWREVVRELREWREESARKNPGLAEPWDVRAERDWNE